MKKHLKELAEEVKKGKTVLGLLEDGENKGKLVQDVSFNGEIDKYFTKDNLYRYTNFQGGPIKRLADLEGIIGEITINSKALSAREISEVSPKWAETVENMTYIFTPLVGEKIVDCDRNYNSETKIYDIYNKIDEIDLKNAKKEIISSNTETLFTEGTVSVLKNGDINVSRKKVEDDYNTAYRKVGENKYIIDKEIGTRTRVETVEETTYTKKEIITPIRAYKVMGEEKPVVTHYYRLKHMENKVGTIIVKYVDINGNSIAGDVIVKNNVVVAKAIIKSSGETTYESTNEKYTVRHPETIVVDGLTFKFKQILPKNEKWNNSVEESGLVKEGVTTIVYQYVLQLKKAPEVETPEYTGGATTVNPPVVDVPEYRGLNEDPVSDSIPNGKHKLETQKTENETPKQKNSVLTQQSEENENPVLQPVHKQEELPQTGTEQEIAIFIAAVSSILAGLGLIVPISKKKNGDEIK